MSPAVGAGVALVLALALAPPAGAAPPARQAPGWAFSSPSGEAVLALATTSTLATTFLPQRFSPATPSSVRPYDVDYDALSDLTGSAIGALYQTTSGYMFEAAYLDAGGARDPYQEALHAPLIDAEAVVLTSGIVLALKRLVGRCRPRDWVKDHCLATVSAHEGFPSGHTGPIAAIAGAHLGLALRTEGDASLRYAPFALAEVGTLGTAVLRVLAGAHTWEDVAVGWGIGHAVGLLVSFAHPFAQVPARAASSRGTGAASLAWSGSF